MARVYFAAPLALAPRARELAAILRERGCEILSTWIFTTDAVDPTREDVRKNIMVGNLLDLMAADVVVALLDDGNPRATLVEIGYAIAKRKPVIWLHAEDGRGRNIFDAHDQVTRVTSWDGVIGALRLHPPAPTLREFPESDA